MVTGELKSFAHSQRNRAMIRNFFQPHVFACAATALLLGALTIGPFMHETDQAWLLDGGVGIANGHWEIARTTFNFDKQFVSFAFVGELFTFFPRPFDAGTLVIAASLAGFIFFWAALLCLLARRKIPLSFALPVILTPAFLVNSPFYASAFVSAGFVMLLATFLDRNRWNTARHALVFVLAFCAVGARADAILLLPLLAMLHSSRPTFLSVLKSPNTWLMAAAGLLALLAGVLAVFSEGISHYEISRDFSTRACDLKQFLAYVVFGLGGAGVLLAVEFHALWRARSAGRCRIWTGFLALGLAIPMGYYSPQLLSPRHCVVGALSALLFMVAKPGRAILHIYFRQKFWGATAKWALLISAIAPVFIGFNVADLRHPRPTFAQPTLFPAAAGVSPMGSYLGHALNFRRQHGFVDQNQAIWAAATSTKYEADSRGRVEILRTPMESYLYLAIRLQGLSPHHSMLPIDQLPPRFYMENRSLSRFRFLWPAKIVSAEKFFSTTTLVPATAEDWHGLTILRCTTNTTAGADSLSAALWALNEVFGGDEFRIEKIASLQKVPCDWAGKRIVLASHDEFTVTAEQHVASKKISSEALGDWHVCEIGPVRAGESIRLQTALPQRVFLSVSVLPEWMSLRTF
jgi:hypothetical protein